MRIKKTLATVLIGFLLGGMSGYIARGKLEPCPPTNQIKKLKIKGDKNDTDITQKSERGK